MERPNIVFILTDQQRADTLSCYGGKICSTPNIDKLAEESIVFKNAYTVCPVCSPARATLQTGVYPFKHGMQGNIYSRGTLVHELADTPQLLSRQLLSLGYQVGYTGKWHLGKGMGDIPRTHNKKAIFPDCYIKCGSLPTTLGYVGEDFPGHGNGGYQFPQYRNYLNNNNLEFEVVNEGERWGNCFGEVVSPLESTNEYYLTTMAIRHIEEFLQRGKPFFFMLNFWGPHEPYYAPSEYLELYRRIEIPPWPNFNDPLRDKPSIHNVKRKRETSWNVFAELLRYYYGFMSSIDAQVGRLLKFLRTQGVYDETVIIFSADHGESLGIHKGLIDKSFFMYEETTRIPLIIKPAVSGLDLQKVGWGEENVFCNTSDIYSTILELAGLSREESERDGKSLVPFIERKGMVVKNDESVTESSGLEDTVFLSRMIRWGVWKYVFNCGDMNELYNLEEDPYELVNLVNDSAYVDVLSESRERLREWMKEKGDDALSSFESMRLA